MRSGIDLELHPAEWQRFGEIVGLWSDYTSERMPGPDCQIDGVFQPIFLPKAEFENWLSGQFAASGPGADVAIRRDARAFSLKEVSRCTALSRSKLYEEIEAKRLRVRKCGNRTLVLETDLNDFLRILPSA